MNSVFLVPGLRAQFGRCLARKPVSILDDICTIPRLYDLYEKLNQLWSVTVSKEEDNTSKRFSSKSTSVSGGFRGEEGAERRGGSVFRPRAALMGKKRGEEKFQF